MAAENTIPSSVEILDHVGDGVYFVDKKRTIYVWNKSAERITGFKAEEVAGRCCSENILTHVDDGGICLCQGQCPLAHTLADGKPREATVNLHHKDGYRVPVHINVIPIHDEQGQIVGAVETFRECADVLAMRSMIERLKSLGFTDIQTGLVNRKVVEHRLLERIQEMQRFGWPFGILLVEMDFQKEIQDRWGESGYIAAMRMAAQCVVNALRSLDLVGRWQEGTFLAVVANVTTIELATISERVRMMVDSAYRHSSEGDMHVTVSIGGAAADQRDNIDTLLRKAERALYASRTNGRNRATVAGVPGMDAP